MVVFICMFCIVQSLRMINSTLTYLNFILMIVSVIQIQGSRLIGEKTPVKAAHMA